MDQLNLMLVQYRLCWRSPAENRETIENLLAARQGSPDVIVLPETFTTGFLGDSTETEEGMDGPTVAWLRQMASKLDSVLVGSAVIEDAGRKNRMLWVEPGGQIQVYDKHHLFSYAGEDQRYAAGTQRVVFHYRGWRICPQICYDIRFPAWCRNRDDYDLLLVVANWPGARIDAWSTLLKARAIENQCYVAAVNRVGIDGNDVEYPGASVVHGPLGETLLKLDDEERCGNVEIDLSVVRSCREKMPFHRDADRFEIEGPDSG
jgi:predicted amidohydrolase